jgi:hypothetical protein
MPDIRNIDRRTFLRRALIAGGSMAMASTPHPASATDTTATGKDHVTGTVVSAPQRGRVEVQLDDGRTAYFDVAVPHRTLSIGDRVVAPVGNDYVTPLFWESEGVLVAVGRDSLTMEPLDVETPTIHATVDASSMVHELKRAGLELTPLRDTDALVAGDRVHMLCIQNVAGAELVVHALYPVRTP